MKVLVCFHDHGDYWFSKYLRWGFRHVFILIQNKGYWIMLDGRMGNPVLEVVAEENYDIATYYRCEHGFTVWPTTIERGFWVSPFMTSTCVGAAKRVMGINAPFVITPYQLYRYLKRRKQHG